MNQVVSSGTNFFLGLYLVRSLSIEAFGLYGIAYAFILFYSGVVNSLFVTQMVVNYPDRDECDRNNYCARMLISKLLFSLFSVVVLFLLYLFISKIYFIYNYVYVFCVLLSSITYTFKEFFVRYSYTAKREGWALSVNSITSFFIFFILYLLGVHGDNPPIEGILYAFSLSNFLGGVLGVVLSRLPVFSVNLKDTSSDFFEAWNGGKWALVGTVIIWMQSQAYVYVSAIFLGPVGVGVANAARLLVAPAMFAVPAVTQLVMPRLAELRNQNIKKMYNVGGIITVGLVVFSIFYAFLLIALGDYVVVLLGDKYGDIQTLLLVWCLVLVFQFTRIGTSTVLQVVKKFRGISLVNFFSALIAVVAAIALMKYWGVEGAVLGTAVGELLLSIGLYGLLRRTRKGVERAYSRKDMV